MKHILSELRLTVALALPIATGHVGQMLIGVVDTAMIGHAGVVPLAAAGFANSTNIAPLVGGMGILSAVGVCSALAYGAKDTVAGSRSFTAGMALAFIVGCLIFAILIGLSFFLHLFGQPPEVITEVRPYFLICAASMIFVMLTTGAKSVFEAINRPWLPFWIVMGSVALNAGLNWIMIYGNLGCPAMGLTGAAWATFIARFVAMLVLVALICKKIPFLWGGIIKEIFRQIRLGFPIGLSLFFETLAFGVAGLMVGWIDATSMAAHQIAMTCGGIFFMFSLGISQAACVRIGHMRGSGELDRTRHIARGSLLLSAKIMLIGTAFFIIFRHQITSCFTSAPELASITAVLLIFAGCFQLFDGAQVVASGILRGFEDVRFPLFIYIFTYWVIVLPLCYLLGFTCGFGLYGIWVALTLGIVSVALSLVLRVEWRIRNLTSSPIKGLGDNSWQREK